MGWKSLPLGIAAAALLPMAAVAQRSAGTEFVALPIPVVAAVGRSLPLGHADPARLLHLVVCLRFRDAGAAQAFADSVSDPSSPNYGQFIGPEDVGALFGPGIAQLNSVVSHFAAQGMSVQLLAKNRLSISVTATVAQAEAAFHTTINEYEAFEPSGNREFIARATPIQVPSYMAPLIVDVAGLETYTRPKRYSVSLTPAQARALYGFAPIYASGMRGQGRNVAISNWDGFQLSNLPLYYRTYSLWAPPAGVGSNVKVITIDGGSESSTPQGEGDIDIQMVLGMAPLCNLIIYDGGQQNADSAFLNVLIHEANDNLADIVTESYGWSLDAAAETAAHNEHVSMSAEGITYINASGDSGTSIEGDYNQLEPESLHVGGTVATVTAAGSRISEVGWELGGGGWSTDAMPFNVRPAWQTGPGVPNLNYRLEPDVALHASSDVGAYWFFYAGRLTTASGTSFSAPVFAGSLAVAEQDVIGRGGLPANSKGKRRFGRIQNLLYSEKDRPDVWFDVTSGYNGVLPDSNQSYARPGWDTVTGLGAINFLAFANIVVDPVPVVLSFSVAPSAVQGGSNLDGYFLLSNAPKAVGQSVKFTSSNVLAVPTPASYPVAPGQLYAHPVFATRPVAQSVAVTLTASCNGVTQSATATLKSPAVTRVTLLASSVVGGGTVSGMVYFSSPVPANAKLELSSSNPYWAAPTQNPIVIPAGAVSLRWSAKSFHVSQKESVVLSAYTFNTVATVKLTVLP